MHHRSSHTSRASIPDLDALRTRLLRIDGRGYRAYREIRGAYRAPRFTLHIDHVQGDPFAEPSRLRATVPSDAARLPAWAYATPARRVAAADFLNRTLDAALAERSGDAGSGRSGELRILRPGQQVLPRTSVVLDEQGGVEARFRAGLPARGRSVLGRRAAQLLTRDVVDAIHAGLFFDALDPDALRLHLETVEDARALRDQLEARGLVAFIADGAILPRRSGVDDRPLPADRARAFRSPPELRVTLDTPNAGAVTGMGIPAGVTLIVGGGYHGKSTLLQAIERGVYDHVPGDGRERVVAAPGAVKVQAESGRSIAGTDISNFIRELPGGEDTRHFYTRNASGSTSQAAAIVEAVEAGATCLLLDEDTSATNFLIRDARMQTLVPDALEPITPLIDRVRQLAERGVSTLMVVGGSGDYFDVADTVIAMVAYEPRDVTADAHRVARAHPTGRRPEGGAWRSIAGRAPLPASLDPSRGRRDVAIKAWSPDRLQFGAEEVNLAAVAQIVERAQLRAIAAALARYRGDVIDGRRPITEVLPLIMDRLEREGLAGADREASGELAAFRVHELAAVLNRLRTLETRPTGAGSD
ncbi:MAG TPA: ABC-ATPase domain-containing protein [Longimicrobiales bacterium]